MPTKKKRSDWKATRKPKLATGVEVAKDILVEEIVLAMAAGDWHPRLSRERLAKKHNLSLDSAHKYCAEAARLLRMSWGGDEAKTAVLERINAIGHSALARTEDALDVKGNVVSLSKPDHRTALASARALADLLGMGSTATITMRYSTMSDSELYKETQKFIHQLEAGHDGTIETTAEDTGLEPVPVVHRDGR